jgi:Fe-S-cluster-containing hydrogenase component 2
MTAGFLFNVAFNDANNIRVLPGLCKRLRIKKSNCQRCVEICPENAILLNRGPTISSSCTECGLCQNVCPTEVFRHEWYTDRYLLNQAKAFLKPSRLQLSDKKKAVFSLSPGRGPGKKFHSPSVFGEDNGNNHSGCRAFRVR